MTISDARKPDDGVVTEFESAAVIHREPGMFWIEVEKLPGCFASGESMADLQEALADALSLYLSDGSIAVEITKLDLLPIDEDFPAVGEFRVLVSA